MKLIIVRHGETIENKLGIHQGQALQGNLSPEGHKQVESLALRLNCEKINLIYSSDLKRAVDTAKEIAKYHQGISVLYVKELRERFTGSFGGKKREEIAGKKYPPEAETYDAMKERAKKFLDEVYNEHSNETVLFVTHGAFCLAAISVILNKPHEDILKERGKFKNASVSIFEFSEDYDNKIILYNCTEHLQ